MPGKTSNALESDNSAVITIIFYASEIKEGTLGRRHEGGDWGSDQRRPCALSPEGGRLPQEGPARKGAFLRRVSLGIGGPGAGCARGADEPFTEMLGARARLPSAACSRENGSHRPVG